MNVEEVKEEANDLSIEGLKELLEFCEDRIVILEADNRDQE